jgi:hypothetical protein
LRRREIGTYSDLKPNTLVCFVDVSDAALPLPPGTTREQLLARFHVRSRVGELLSGAQAFLALWAVLPGWCWLGSGGTTAGRGLGDGARLSPLSALGADAARLGLAPGTPGSTPLTSATSTLKSTT